MLGKRENESGGVAWCVRGSGCYLKRPRREEGRSHDAVRGRRLRRGASGRLGAAPTGGPGRSVAGRGRLPGAGAGAATGLGAAAGLATPRRAAGLRCRAGPRAAAGLSGEGERRVNGPHGKKAMWAENKEGGDDHFHFLFSKQIFPKAFSNIFLKSFEL